MSKEKILTWADISLEQYDKMMEINDRLGEDNEVEKLLAIMILLYGGTEEYYGQMFLDDYNAMASKLLGFIMEPPKPTFRTGEYRIADRVYQLTSSVKGMTAAQYIDFTTIQRDEPNNIAALLTCVLVPKGKKYNEGYDIDALEETIYKELSWQNAMGIADFYQRVLKVSTAVTLDYSLKKLRRELKKETNPEKKTIIAEAITRIEKSRQSGGLGSV